MRSLTRLVRWKLGLVSVEPWSNPGETPALLRHARGKRRLAEIGVWEGGTTRRLREVMDPQGVLFAVDPFPPGRLGLSYQRFMAHGEVRRVRNGRVEWVRATGDTAVADPRVAAAPFDFVFLDADHSYEGTEKSWRAWRPLAADTIALHDAIGPDWRGSVRFVRDHVLPDPAFEVMDQVGCLLVLKRKTPTA